MVGDMAENKSTYRRIATAAFTLATHDAERQFQPGDVVEGDAAAHWYAQHHSELVTDEKPRRKSNDRTDRPPG